MKLRHFAFYIGILMTTAIHAQTDSVASDIAISSFSGISSDARINQTYIDERNVIWLATNQGLKETVSDGSRSNSYLQGIELFDVVADNKGTIWAAGAKSLYDARTGLNYPLPQEVQISDITYLSGSVWVGTSDGVFEFNTVTRKFKAFDERNTPMVNTKVNFMHADKQKVLWVGTDAGYLRVEGDKWKLHDKKLKMLATCENQEGQWIINNEDMVLINKFNRIFPVKIDNTMYKGKINNFVIDSKGRIFMASDILTRYDPYKEVVNNYAADASTLSKAALSLACDKNDNIWIGTDGAGFYKLQFGELASEVLNAVVIIQNAIQCPGAKTGSLKVSVSGGQKPYSYAWSIPDVKETQISNLGSGKYSVTVTDKYQNSAIANIDFSDPAPMTVELINTERVTTPENPNGALNVEIKGGSAPYSFSWSNGATTQNIRNINSGLYSLNVRDKYDCKVTATFNVKREKYIPDLEMAKITVGQKLRINDLNFEADSSAITRASFEILDEVYEFLNANPQVSVEIGGHTNTIPPHEYCDKLSSARSKNVAEYLYNRGIDKKRVKYKGYGKREPLTDATSVAGRQRNQRVEIKILDM